MEYLSSNNESGQGSDPTLGVAFVAFVDARNQKIFWGGGIQLLTRGSPTNFTISKTHILENQLGGVRTPAPLCSGSVNVVLYLPHHSREKAEGPPHFC